MKTLKYIVLLACAYLMAACDDSATFYTAVYSVTEVEAEVTLKKTEPETPAPQTEAETPEIPDPEQIVATVSAEVLAAAPVAAQGRYTLDFSRHNGGTLTVVTAPDATPIRGTFSKQPGASELLFTYGGQHYTCKIAFYTNAANARRVVLEADLTKQYQELHPDWNIETVTRRELTSASN